MLISIFPSTVFDDRITTISHKELPDAVKVWALGAVYAATDWFYEYADDNTSYNRGRKSVEDFYKILFELYPAKDDRLEIVYKMDIGDHISVPRVSEESYHAR